MTSEDMVVVARFDGPGAWGEADIVRLRLVAHGIAAVVAGDPHVQGGMFTEGLVRIEVRAADAEAARELLEDA